MNLPHPNHGPARSRSRLEDLLALACVFAVLLAASWLFQSTPPEAPPRPAGSAPQPAAATPLNEAPPAPSHEPPPAIRRRPLERLENWDAAALSAWHLRVKGVKLEPVSSTTPYGIELLLEFTDDASLADPASPNRPPLAGRIEVRLFDAQDELVATAAAPGSLRLSREPAGRKGETFRVHVGQFEHAEWKAWLDRAVRGELATR